MVELLVLHKQGSTWGRVGVQVYGGGGESGYVYLCAQGCVYPGTRVYPPRELSPIEILVNWFSV